MFKHILLATDGSPASEHAATLAAELAHAGGASLSIVYVVDPYPYLGVGEANPYGFQAYMAAALAYAAEAQERAKLLCMQVDSQLQIQSRTVEDLHAAAGIVQTAQSAGADLIVLGSHGRSGLARLMLGSVANKVVSESPLPVLVAR